MRNKIWIILALAVSLILSGCNSHAETSETKTNAEISTTEDCEQLISDADETQACELLYLMSEVVYELSGLEITRMTFQYDDQHRVIEQCSTGANYQTEWHYEYTEDGYTIVSSLGDVSEVIVNKNGDDLRRTDYDSNGQIVESVEYVYGEDGQLQEVRTYNAEGEEISREINVYDHDGKKLSSAKYVIDYESIWDESEKKEYGVNYIHKGTATTSLFTYDDSGRLIEQRDVQISNSSYGWNVVDGVSVDCEICDNGIIKYDYSENNTVTVIQYDANGNEYSRTTEKYDLAGNCIERIYKYTDENRPDMVMRITYIGVEVKETGAK